MYIVNKRIINKKGEAVIGITALILALIILAIFLIGIAQRECSKNRDCPGNAYCGSDFECHEYPNQIIVKDRSYLLAAFIIGIAFIIAAHIYRGGKFNLSSVKKIFDFHDDGGHDDHHH